MVFAYGWKQTELEFEADLGYCPNCGAHNNSVVSGFRTTYHISGLPFGGWNKHWICSCKNCGKTRKLKGKEVKAAAVRSGCYPKYIRFARAKELLTLSIILLAIGLITLIIAFSGQLFTNRNITELDLKADTDDTRVIFDSVVLLDYFATSNNEDDDVTAYYFAGIFTGGDGRQYMASFEIQNSDDLFKEAEAYIADTSLQMGDFVVPVYGQLNAMKDDLSPFYKKYQEELNTYKGFKKINVIQSNVAYITPTLKDSEEDDKYYLVIGLILFLPGLILLGIYLSKPHRVPNMKLLNYNN